MERTDLYVANDRYVDNEVAGRFVQYSEWFRFGERADWKIGYTSLLMSKYLFKVLKKVGGTSHVLVVCTLLD